jgi:hypothetical protein
MVAQTAFGRPERQMMLHPVAREDLNPASIKMNGQGHYHGTFRKLQPGALILRYLQKIRHDIKLPASHAKGWVIVNFHRRSLMETTALTTRNSRAGEGTGSWRDAPAHFFEVDEIAGLAKYIGAQFGCWTRFSAQVGDPGSADFFVPCVGKS